MSLWKYLSRRNPWYKTTGLQGSRDGHFFTELDKETIKINAFMSNYLEQELKNLGISSKEKVLGVLYRGTDFISAAGHQNPLSIEKFITHISEVFEKLKYDKIFLATEVQEVVEKFKHIFGDKVCFVEQERYSQDERRILSSIKSERENDEYLKSVEYLSVLLILSKCDSLIGSHCGGTDIALELGKEYEYCEIFGNKEKTKINFEKYIRFFRRKMKLGEYSPLYRKFTAVCNTSSSYE